MNSRGEPSRAENPYGWGEGWALYDGSVRVARHLPHLRAHAAWLRRLSAAPDPDDARYFAEAAARADAVIQHLGG